MKMNVLIKWDDGSENVVSSDDLVIVKGQSLKVGTRVKMLYGKKYYYGMVMMLEEEYCESSDSEEDLPLAFLRKQGT